MFALNKVMGEHGVTFPETQMPKTISSPEWLLANIAGRERATAILGDFSEMAAT